MLAISNVYVYICVLDTCEIRVYLFILKKLYLSFCIAIIEIVFKNKLLTQNNYQWKKGRSKQ